jgi:hypothetical protein
MSKSKDLDRRYQDCVDELARKTLELSRDELLDYEDYGSVDHGGIGVGFWHYTLANGDNHIVFVTNRKLVRFLPVYHKYIAGVVFGPEKEPRLMTDEESGEYD